jgi:hypothetical protein
MKLNVEGFKDVNWGQYRAYSRVIDELTEGWTEEYRAEISINEWTEVMLCAGVISGWVEGMEAPDIKKEDYADYLSEFRESLEGEHPGNVMKALNDFRAFYNKLSTPDPN